MTDATEPLAVRATAAWRVAQLEVTLCGIFGSHIDLTADSRAGQLLRAFVDEVAVALDVPVAASPAGLFGFAHQAGAQTFGEHDSPAPPGAALHDNPAPPGGALSEEP